MGRRTAERTAAAEDRSDRTNEAWDDVRSSAAGDGAPGNGAPGAGDGARGDDADAARSMVHARITRNGVHMAFVAVFAILGGSIRGFNLLVFLAGLMVGVLVVQWRFSRALLPGLSVRRVLPSEAYAERPFKVRFVVRNARAWLPGWMIRVEDRVRSVAAGRTRDSQAVCHVPSIAPRATETAHYDCVVMRRGRYFFGPVRLATGYPLGLIYAWRNMRLRESLLVYPALVRLAPHWSDVIFNRREGLAASQHRSGQTEGEFFGIRSWQNGDSRRWIHWRTTARIGELAVRQFEQPSRLQLSLLLDPCLEDGEDDSAVERAISVAASIVLALTSGASNRLALGIADASERAVFSHRSTDFRRGAMALLAGTRPLADPPLARTLARTLRDGSPQWPVLVISSRGPRMDLLGDGDRETQSSGISSALLSRLDVIWLDVTSSAAERVVMQEDVYGTA